MAQSLDDATNRELLTELHERLKGVNFEAIQTRVDEMLNDPAVTEGVKGAEKKLDHLREVLPNIIQEKMLEITGYVADELGVTEPDATAKIKDYKLSDEDIEKLKNHVDAAKENFRKWYDERLRDTVNDAVGNLKETITKQYNKAVIEEAQNSERKADQAPIEMAQKIAKKWGNEAMQPGVPSQLKAMMDMTSREYVESIVEQANKILESDGKPIMDISKVLPDDVDAPAVGGMAPK